MSQRKRARRQTTIPSLIPGVAIETDANKTAAYLNALNERGAVLQVDVVGPKCYEDLRAAASAGDEDSRHLLIEAGAALRTSTGRPCLICETIITEKFPGGVVRLREADPMQPNFFVLPLCWDCAEGHPDLLRGAQEGLRRVLDMPHARFFRDDLHQPGHA